MDKKNALIFVNEVAFLAMLSCSPKGPTSYGPCFYEFNKIRQYVVNVYSKCLAESISQYVNMPAEG